MFCYLKIYRYNIIHRFKTTYIKRETINIISCTITVVLQGTENNFVREEALDDIETFPVRE